MLTHERLLMWCTLTNVMYLLTREYDRPDSAYVPPHESLTA
jgi:hypothetical protein